MFQYPAPALRGRHLQQRNADRLAILRRRALGKAFQYVDVLGRGVRQDLQELGALRTRHEAEQRGHPRPVPHHPRAQPATVAHVVRQRIETGAQRQLALFRQLLPARSHIAKLCPFGGRQAMPGGPRAAVTGTLRRSTRLPGLHARGEAITRRVHGGRLRHGDPRRVREQQAQVRVGLGIRAGQRQPGEQGQLACQRQFRGRGQQLAIGVAGNIGGVEAGAGRFRGAERVHPHLHAPLVDQLAPTRVQYEGRDHRQRAQQQGQPQPAQAAAMAGLGGCIGRRLRPRHGRPGPGDAPGRLWTRRVRGGRWLRHLRQFPLRLRPPRTPDIDIGLAEHVTREGIADPRLVALDIDPQRGSGIGFVEPGHQVQQHRRALLRWQPGNPRQGRSRRDLRLPAQRRSGQQQPPELARPFGDRRLPGLAGEHPRGDLQGLGGGRVVATGLHVDEQRSPTGGTAQERRYRRRDLLGGRGHGRAHHTAPILAAHVRLAVRHVVPSGA